MNDSEAGIEKPPRLDSGRGGTLSRAGSEAELSAAVAAALQTAPGIWWRVNSGTVVTADNRRVRMAPPGTADYLGCIRGRYFALELKAKTTVRESQALMAVSIMEEGGTYAFARTALWAVERIHEFVNAKPGAGQILTEDERDAAALRRHWARLGLGPFRESA